MILIIIDISASVFKMQLRIINNKNRAKSVCYEKGMSCIRGSASGGSGEA